MDRNKFWKEEAKGWSLALIFLSIVDAWSTYMCLSHPPIEGVKVSELNPFSDWLFSQIGLLPGLGADLLLTLIALHWFYHTHRLGNRNKTIFLFLASCVTAWAAWNNFQILSELREVALLFP